MRSTKSSSVSIAVYTAFAFFFAIVVLPSCSTSKKYNFSTSSTVPSAEGKVKVKKDGNNNYKIELDVIRLATPERLSPPKAMYVVWMETEENGRKNLGQLKTSSSLISKTLKSSLKTVSAFNPTSFFITAEDQANVQYPGDVILKTESN